MTVSQKVLINEDVLSICYPFYYIRTILCVRDYNIIDNYVRKVSFKNILCTVFGNCIILYLLTSTMMYSTFSMSQYIITYNIMYGEFLLQFFVVSILNLYHSSTSVQLLSTIYEINRCLYCSEDTKNFKFIARASVFAIWLSNFFFFVYKLFFDTHWSWMRVIFVTITLFLDVEVLYMVLFIHIITCKTRKWNADIESIDLRINSNDVMIDLDTNLNEMHHVLNSLIEAWNLIAETAGLKVLLHFITTFMMSLVYVTVSIIWLKGKFYDRDLAISHSVGISLILPKMLTVELALSLCCEAFYTEISKAKTNILLKLSQNSSSKKRWINIQRVLDTDIKEMTASGGFPVDAAFMMQFIKTITAYTVVLLQFAFL